jgi:hypothetical protein
MSSALLAIPAILAPLQSLWRWLMPALPKLPSTLLGRSTPSSQPSRHYELARHSMANKLHCRGGKRPAPGHDSAHRPLRIVRVMEAGQTPAQVGRMVISGRMADVCAELDRLAACEAALY